MDSVGRALGGAHRDMDTIMAYPWVSTQGERHDIPYLFLR